LQKLLLFAALALLYLTNLAGTGFLGPDEPRYASIGREMAHSGDWITPKLDGQPWFEKPPLLYWTNAAAHLSHLNDEWAARLPVALIGLVFLFFFHRTLAREFSPAVALTSTAILGTSAGWAALSFAAVTDMPMAAALNGALLVSLFGPQALGSRSSGGRVVRYTAQGWVAGALLGLAVLAKAFVPIVLIAPVFLVARGKRLQMVLACIAIAAPWYLLCFAINGRAFWDDIFWKQQVGRFFSPELEHVQPFWWYVPVLLAGMFPWTPLIALIPSRRALEDERVRFLLIYIAWGFVFFSASTNKLPGYLLPLLPAMAVVMGVALDKSKYAARWLVACALLLIGLPVIAAILPDALNNGISHIGKISLAGWAPVVVMLIPLGAAAAAWWFAREDADQEWSGRRKWSALVVAMAAILSMGYLKWVTFPVLDKQVSVRAFWREHKDEISQACYAYVRRSAVYGLNYYAQHPLPECKDDSQRPRIIPKGDDLVIESASR
jgi:4-amino-4-deoxy-L-arabinose transferase-like glycosyltransferase